MAFMKNATLFSDNAQPGTLAHAMRMQSTLSVMDPAVRGYIFEQLREAEAELHVQQAVTRQLEAELQAEIHRDHKNGTANSLLFQKLPPEIRAHIFSYVVAAEKSVHVFPPRGNESHGYRLSLCDEDNYDFDLGHCRCDDSRTRGNLNVTSNFFDNAIFLVSQSVRREALDAFFLTNNFTFTCLYELVRFTCSFKASSSKIQHIRVLERVDDYPNPDFRIKAIQMARQRLKALKHLEIYVYLPSWSAHETWHEDGLVNQLVHFALGPPPASQAQQAKKRKLFEIDDDSSLELGTPKTAKLMDSSSTDTPAETGSTMAKVEQSSSSTSSQSEAEQLISGLPAPPKSTPVEVCNSHQSIFTSSASESSSQLSSMSTSTSSCLSAATDSILPFPSIPALSSLPNEPQTAFPIPPLKSFRANVRLRNLQMQLRGRPENVTKAEYYASLYTRLTDHLTDVFLDNGRKYRVIEDVPSLGPKPKLKIREEERALRGAEKRGILYLKD